MEYVEIADAKTMPGMRLALVSGLPSPWSEAAKAIYRLKGIPYTPVAQIGNQANEELVAWTGYRNAPVAVYEAERPRGHWLEILMQAERIAPDPSLLPDSIHDRVSMIGLAHEVCGESGLLWYARQLMMDAMVKALGEDFAKTPMFSEYDYCRENVERAPAKIMEVLDALAARLVTQRPTAYFIGEQMTALDIYWAYFSLPFDNLPPEQNPMLDVVRQMWDSVASVLDDAGYRLDPALIRHRDFMFEKHLTLPLAF